MSARKISVTLLESEKKVEKFRLSRGLNFSEALRYIIDDYFERLSKSNTDFFNSGVIDEMKTIKSEVIEVKNMVLVIGHNDDELHEEFVKYFPKYFKTKE